MGRKFDMSRLSPGNLRMEVTAASLSGWWTEPELRNELIVSIFHPCLNLGQLVKLGRTETGAER